VIQQGGSPVSAQAQLSVGAADDAYEREADRVADAVMRSGAAAPSITSFASASVQRSPCVTGRFDKASAPYRNPGDDAKALTGAWNRATGWYESPLRIEATFQPDAGKTHCADGEMRLYAKGEVTRHDPLPSGASDPTGKAGKVPVPPLPVEFGLQATPVKAQLRNGVEFFRYLPHAGDCGILAQLAPGVRAERAGEHLRGFIIVVAELVDKCDLKAPRYDAPLEERENVLDRMACYLSVKLEVPQDFRSGAVSASAPGSGKSAEAKDPAPGIKGEFTNIPSGNLVAAWDPGRKWLGREFYMRARFEPPAGTGDCEAGEYRQFARAQWIRQARGGQRVEQKPGPGQPPEITKRLCEDTAVEEEAGSEDKVNGRYGYRKDKFLAKNLGNVYGPDELRGCLYEGWDYPHITPRSPGETVEIHHQFVGQLIDKRQAAREEPDGPFTKGVLAESRWRIDGSFTAPDNYVPPAAEAKTKPEPAPRGVSGRPGNIRGTTMSPASPGESTDKKDDKKP